MASGRDRDAVPMRHSCNTEAIPLLHRVGLEKSSGRWKIAKLSLERSYGDMKMN